MLNIAFRIADEQGLLLLDLKDLRALLQLRSPRTRPKLTTTSTATSSKATVGTIQRQLLVLENQGGDEFFGEPALDIKDLMRTDRDGRGVVNILAADKLMDNPRLYATFLLWLLSELFEELPEVGDLDKPKLVFFFDEAHLLFNDAPQGAARDGRAGRAPHPLEGRRRLFRHAEPARRARNRAGAARQPRAARAARLHAARPEGGAGGGRRPSARTRPSTPRGDHRARRRRGAGLDARGQGRALDGRAHADRARRSAQVGPIDAGRAPARRSRRARCAASTSRRSIRESAYEMLAKRAAEGRGGRRRPRRRRRHPRHDRRHASAGHAQARLETARIGRPVTAAASAAPDRRSDAGAAWLATEHASAKRASSAAARAARIGRAIVRGTLAVAER